MGDFILQCHPKFAAVHEFGIGPSLSATLAANFRCGAARPFPSLAGQVHGRTSAARVELCPRTEV